MDELPDPRPSFFDALGCPHPRFVDEPDALGESTCAVCETRVRRVLTELAWKTSFNRLAEHIGMPAIFPDVD